MGHVYEQRACHIFSMCMIGTRRSGSKTEEQSSERWNAPSSSSNNHSSSRRQHLLIQTDNNRPQNRLEIHQDPLKQGRRRRTVVVNSLPAAQAPVVDRSWTRLTARTDHPVPVRTWSLLLASTRLRHKTTRMVGISFFSGSLVIGPTIVFVWYSCHAVSHCISENATPSNVVCYQHVTCCSVKHNIWSEQMFETPQPLGTNTFWWQTNVRIILLPLTSTERQ